MATSSRTATTTISSETRHTSHENPPTLVLELTSPSDNGPRVRWSEETVDNEYMNKKKSKCCCIYTKPHDPQSDANEAEEDKEFDNCQHCRNHTESDYAAKAEDRQPKVKVVIRKPDSS